MHELTIEQMKDFLKEMGVSVKDKTDEQIKISFNRSYKLFGGSRTPKFNSKRKTKSRKTKSCK